MNFWENVRKYLSVLGVSLIPILVLRYVGWIDSVTSALGPVAVAIVFLVIRDFAPDTFKRPCYWIAGVILALTVLLPVGWGMWGVWAPEVQRAWRYSAKERSILKAERDMSVGLVGKASKHHVCNEVDRLQGEVIEAAHRVLLEDIRKRPFDDELLRKLDNLEDLQRKNVARRQKCKDFMASLTAGPKLPRAEHGASESSEFIKFFRNTWESYRSKLAVDQLLWALIAFAVVALLVVKVFMKRRGTISAPTASSGGSTTKYEYVVMGLWVGAAAFLAALTAFYGMGHWLIPSIVLGTAILWAVINGKNQSWQNGLVLACLVWVMVGLGVGLVWAGGWDAHSEEQYYRAGARSAVGWLIGRPLPR